MRNLPWIGWLSVLLVVFETACVGTTPISAQLTDPSARYLRQSVMAVPAATLATAVAASGGRVAVCLPAGLPVFDVTPKGGKHQVLVINKTLIGGWGATYEDLLPTDCLYPTKGLYALKKETQPQDVDNEATITDETRKVEIAPMFYTVTGAPDGTILPAAQASPVSLAAVANDPEPLVKNAAAFKSGFLGNPMYLASLPAAPSTVTAAQPAATVVANALCLPRGTRVNIWTDSVDMARTAVEPVDTDGKDCNGASLPKDDKKVYYAPTAAVANAVTSWEFASGALVVPFKYYLAGDKSFVGSASVGPYIGARIRWSNSGTEWTAALFGGYTSISVSTSTTAAPAAGTKAGGTPASTSQTNSISGFTGGLAFFTSLGDNYKAQAGVVLGWDFVSESAKWVNNHKPWLALEFGYAFF